MTVPKPGYARILTAVVAASLLAAPASAFADSGERVAASTRSGPRLVDAAWDSDRTVTISVYSAAMDRDIPLEVIVPADSSEPRPTLYLLNGAGGGEDGATWRRQTDVVDFFEDKDVYVVTPLEGAFSYYTDWHSEDPKLGRQKWQTFLLDELPPVIDETFGTNGVQSIAAISMTATSVLNLAIARPGFYKSVGSYSGCAETSTWAGRTATRIVGLRGGVDVTNMWGPFDGPGWVENDPVVNAELLRGTELYVTTASGLPGPHETLIGLGIEGRPDVLANQVVGGGVIELATNYCTRNLADRLADLGIPATFEFKSEGTHSWGYWQDDLHNSWPMIAASMGI